MIQLVIRHKYRLGNHSIGHIIWHTTKTNLYTNLLVKPFIKNSFTTEFRRWQPMRATITNRLKIRKTKVNRILRHVILNIINNIQNTRL